MGTMSGRLGLYAALKKRREAEAKKDREARLTRSRDFTVKGRDERPDKR